MNKKELVKKYKSAILNDRAENTAESKKLRLEALAAVGRDSKATKKFSRDSQLTLFEQ